MEQDEPPVEVKHKKFSNGDVYIGGWRAGLVSSGARGVQRPPACSSRRAARPDLAAAA